MLNFTTVWVNIGRYSLAVNRYPLIVIRYSLALLLLLSIRTNNKYTYIPVVYDRNVQALAAELFCS